MSLTEWMQPTKSVQFIPFFTTKSNGSGIGLSLSRQILIKQGFMLSLEEKAQTSYNVTFVIENDV